MLCKSAQLLKQKKLLTNKTIFFICSVFKGYFLFAWYRKWGLSVSFGITKRIELFISNFPDLFIKGFPST